MRNDSATSRMRSFYSSGARGSGVRYLAVNGIVRLDNAKSRPALAACQNKSSMSLNENLHRALYDDLLGARRLGVAVDLEHHVRCADHNFHSAPLLFVDRARDSLFDLTGHDS